MPSRVIGPLFFAEIVRPTFVSPPSVEIVGALPVSALEILINAARFRFMLFNLGFEIEF